MLLHIPAYLDLPLTTSSPIFIHISGLTLDCQFFSFYFFSLTWTYLQVPVWLCFDFITYVYLIGLTPLMSCWMKFETPWQLRSIWITFFPPQRSFWNFYRMQDFFLLCIPVSNKKTYIWCKVSRNVWLCMNEMSEHLNSFFSSEFVLFLLHLSSFLAKCRMQMLCPHYADEITWLVLPMWYANIVP